MPELNLSEKFASNLPKLIDLCNACSGESDFKMVEDELDKLSKLSKRGDEQSLVRRLMEIYKDCNNDLNEIVDHLNTYYDDYLLRQF